MTYLKIQQSQVLLLFLNLWHALFISPTLIYLPHFAWSTPILQFFTVGMETQFKCPALPQWHWNMILHIPHNHFHYFNIQLLHQHLWILPGINMKNHKMLLHILQHPAKASCSHKLISTLWYPQMLEHIGLILFWILVIYTPLLTLSPTQFHLGMHTFQIMMLNSYIFLQQFWMYMLIAIYSYHLSITPGIQRIKQTSWSTSHLCHQNPQHVNFFHSITNLFHIVVGISFSFCHSLLYAAGLSWVHGSMILLASSQNVFTILALLSSPHCIRRVLVSLVTILWTSLWQVPMMVILHFIS